LWTLAGISECSLWGAWRGTYELRRLENVLNLGNGPRERLVWFVGKKGCL
jgi:hypothetical protein